MRSRGSFFSGKQSEKGAGSKKWSWRTTVWTVLERKQRHPLLYDVWTSERMEDDHKTNVQALGRGREEGIITSDKCLFGLHQIKRTASEIRGPGPFLIPLALLSLSSLNTGRINYVNASFCLSRFPPLIGRDRLDLWTGLWNFAFCPRLLTGEQWTKPQCVCDAGGGGEHAGDVKRPINILMSCPCVPLPARVTINLTRPLFRSRKDRQTGLTASRCGMEPRIYLESIYVAGLRNKIEETETHMMSTKYFPYSIVGFSQNVKPVNDTPGTFNLHHLGSSCKPTSHQTSRDSYDCKLPRSIMVCPRIHWALSL